KVQQKSYNRRTRAEIGCNSMKRASKTIQGAGLGKAIIPRCPRHGVPYTMEASSDPVNEGAWKYFFCQRCREERTKDGTAAAK
ncbi:MAG: hypothetical protein WAW96_18660, partial [Alphaproteobacteria bacterium]